MNANEDFIAKLRVARDLIARNGWTQGTYCDLRGCYCAVGALTEAGIPEQTFRLQIGRKTLPRHVATARLISWNDHPHRTRHEVLAMFDNSIAALS